MTLLSLFSNDYYQTGLKEDEVGFYQIDQNDSVRYGYVLKFPIHK